MNLSQEDADLFYKLMWSLQCYINQRTKLIPDELKTYEDVPGLPQEEKITLRNGVYEHISLIADYVQENPHGFDADELQIIAGWVNHVSSDFYMERYLKNHAIFIGQDNVYAVRALYDSFDIMIHKSYLPHYISTVLLPFKGQIIYDGLMFHNNIYFGGGIKASLKEDYMRAKQNGRIIDTLMPSKAKPAKPATTQTKNWSKQMAQLQKAAKPLKGGAGQPPLNSPAFSLIKNSIELGSQAIETPDDADALYAKLKSVKRALTQIENILYRMD